MLDLPRQSLSLLAPLGQPPRQDCRCWEQVCKATRTCFLDLELEADADRMPNADSATATAVRTVRRSRRVAAKLAQKSEAQIRRAGRSLAPIDRLRQGCRVAHHKRQHQLKCRLQAYLKLEAKASTRIIQNEFHCFCRLFSKYFLILAGVNNILLYFLHSWILWSTFFSFLLQICFHRLFACSWKSFETGNSDTSYRHPIWETSSEEVASQSARNNLHRDFETSHFLRSKCVIATRSNWWLKSTSIYDLCYF